MHSQHLFNKKDLFYFSQNVKICNIDSALAHIQNVSALCDPNKAEYSSLI